MYPFFVMADIHAHNYKAHSKLVGGVNSRLLEIESVLYQAQTIALQNGCKFMAIAGDLFHVRGQIFTSAYNRVHRIIQSFATNLPIVLLTGNHDMANYQNGDSALSPLGTLPNVHVLDNKIEYLFGGSIMGVPYIHDINEFKKTVEDNKNVKSDVVFLHVGIDNFKPSVNLPSTSVTVDYLRSVFGDSWVLAGHYHKPFQDGKIISVGAPLQHNFGDEGQERGGWIIYEDRAVFMPIESTKFVTFNIEELEGANIEKAIVRVRCKSKTDYESIQDVAIKKGASDVVVLMEREYTHSHTQQLSISTPEAMFSEYVNIIPKYIPYADKLVSVYQKVVSV